MQYKSLPAAERVSMLQGRIRALELDHYGHEMNKIGLTTMAPSPERTSALEAANLAQSTIEATCAAFHAEIEVLQPSVEPTPTS